MKADIQQFKAALRVVPLLRSIAREMKERVRAIAELESRSESSGNECRARGIDAASLEAQLSLHRRELRRVEKELASLGWARDEDHPLRLLLRRADGGTQIAWRPEDTGFYRVPADSTR